MFVLLTTVHKYTVVLYLMLFALLNSFNIYSVLRNSSRQYCCEIYCFAATLGVMTPIELFLLLLRGAYRFRIYLCVLYVTLCYNIIINISLILGWYLMLATASTAASLALTGVIAGSVIGAFCEGCQVFLWRN